MNLNSQNPSRATAVTSQYVVSSPSFYFFGSKRSLVLAWFSLKDIHRSAALLIALLTLSVFFTTPSFSSEEEYAAEGWKLDRDRSDVRVYLKKIPGSKYKAYRGVTDIEATLGSVVSIFMDIEQMPSWMHELDQASVLKKKDAVNRYLYMVNRAPFPIKDRDFIVGYNFEQDPKDLKVKISIENAPHLHKETQYTHMKIVDGYFSVEPLDSGRVRVTYECHLDPGGKVPSWAANIVISDTPFYTLKNLREQIQKRGNDVVLPYVTELQMRDSASLSLYQ